MLSRVGRRGGSGGRLAARHSAALGKRGPCPSATVPAKAVALMFLRCETTARTDVDAFDLRQLEHQRIADVLLLDQGLANEELARLAVMVGEAFRADALLGTIRPLRRSWEAARRIFARGRPALRPSCSARSSRAHRGCASLSSSSCWKWAIGHFRRIDQDMGGSSPAEAF